MTFRNPVLLNVMCHHQNLLEMNNVCLHCIGAVFMVLSVNQSLRTTPWIASLLQRYAHKDMVGPLMFSDNSGVLMEPHNK
jgi:hypothetical protein